MYDKKAVPVDKRWKVIYGECDGLEGRAIEVLIEGLVAYITEYTIEVSPCDISNANTNIIVVGTPTSNALIRAQMAGEILNDSSYVIRVGGNPYNPQRQMVLIAGADASGVLYGCVDFISKYMPKADYEYNQKPHCFLTRILDTSLEDPAAGKLPEVYIADSPKVKKRGLWTWGHVIYDYRNYLDNMLKLKLNQVIVWNDTKPLNGKEFVDYAHHNGIEVVWGFSWAWGVDIDISQAGEMEKWKNIVLDQCKEMYEDMGGDGIYMQTFTETSDDQKNGKIIAEEAVKWVNYISTALLDAYPELNIQFGLHATSVNNRMEAIAKTDPRVEILWEDCGDFPYDYSSARINHFSETQQFTQKITQLRNGVRYGVILKGMLRLDWENFEYKTGPYMIGCANHAFRKKRMNEKRRYWHYMQSDWIVNGENCRQIVQQLAQGCKGDLTISALVEDGMFEENIWYPVALYSEILWNYERPMNDILLMVARMPEITFA